MESRYECKEMEVMRLKRGCHASLWLDEKIYVFGGQHAVDKVLKRNEVFIVNENRWDIVPQMECKRKYPSACAMGSSAIYLFGGCLPEEVEQEYIECFNPLTNQWKILSVNFPNYAK